MCVYILQALAENDWEFTLSVGWVAVTGQKLASWGTEDNEVWDGVYHLMGVPRDAGRQRPPPTTTTTTTLRHEFNQV